MVQALLLACAKMAQNSDAKMQHPGTAFFLPFCSPRSNTKFQHILIIAEANKSRGAGNHPCPQ